jgi:hypothetical protein
MTPQARAGIPPVSGFRRINLDSLKSSDALISAGRSHVLSAVVGLLGAIPIFFRGTTLESTLFPV